MMNSHIKMLSQLHERIAVQYQPGREFQSIIPREQAEAYCQRHDIDVYEFMQLLVPLAQKYALTPISGFPVGAVVLGQSGNVYLGANSEFRGLTLNFSVHAEQAAVNNAYVAGYGETGLQALAVSAAPCGYCRQYLYELDMADRLLIMVASDRSSDMYLKNLLPAPFGPGDLGIAERLLQPCDHRLEIDTNTQDEVSNAALAAANVCYAPYTKSYAGVALQARNGAIFVGIVSENAAYNPSLSPMQSAISHFSLWSNDFSTITRAALVEVEGAICSQIANATQLLASIAPTIRLESYMAQVGV